VSSAPTPHTAALVLIGNEILSGKIRDDNGSYLLRELRGLGVDVRRVEIVPDEEDLIVDAVRRCREQAVHLFTSGGIGLTHDDVTVPAVARALDRPVIRHPELLAMLRSFYGDAMDDFHARLAEVPEGAELLWGRPRNLRFPAILADDILILPGVPSLFVEKFEAIKERYRAPPIVLVNLFLGVGEDRIAGLLTEATVRFPGIAIGSYPRFDAADHKVKVTVESRDPAIVKDCADFLRSRLGADLLQMTSVA
jgi:molybdenum cofactor synthesis domain-containing protein